MSDPPSQQHHAIPALTPDAPLADGYGGDYDQGPGPGGDAANSIFVQNLQWWTTDVELEAACSQYGPVTGIRFIEDRACGKSRGMAVVDFGSPAAAQACIEQMNGRDINGRPCRVQRQVQRPPPGGGGGMGGRGGGMGGRGRGRGGGSMMMGGPGGSGMDPSMMGMGPGWGMGGMPPMMMMGGPQFRPPPPPGGPQ